MKTPKHNPGKQNAIAAYMKNMPLSALAFLTRKSKIWVGRWLYEVGEQIPGISHVMLPDTAPEILLMQY